MAGGGGPRFLSHLSKKLWDHMAPDVAKGVIDEFESKSLSLSEEDKQNNDPRKLFGHNTCVQVQRFLSKATSSENEYLAEIAQSLTRNGFYCNDAHVRRLELEAALKQKSRLWYIKNYDQSQNINKYNFKEKK